MGGYGEEVWGGMGYGVLALRSFKSPDYYNNNARTQVDVFHGGAHSFFIVAGSSLIRYKPMVCSTEYELYPRIQGD